MRPARALALAAFVLAASLALGCGKPLRTQSLDPERAEIARDQQSFEAVELFLERRARLLALTDRLRVANVEACGTERAPWLGFWGVRRRPGPYSPFLDALLRPHGDGDDLTVILVVPGSPAERAGLLPGDAVLRVNDKRVRDREDPLRVTASEPERAPVLQVERDGAPRTLELEAVPSCALDVLLSLSDGLESGPNPPRTFYVAQGFLAFARDDDELGVVIAHEMAHRILDHPTDAYPDNEIEAERLGLALARRAGFDARVAPALWRRVAFEHPWAIEFEPAYPMAPEPAHGRIPERLQAAREFLESEAGP